MMRFLVCITVLTVALVQCASANVVTESIIYKGDPLGPQNIKLSGWGSGEAVETKERALPGAQSIKVSSRGLYAGAKIDFADPVTLGKAEKDRYLVFTFFFDGKETVDPAAGNICFIDVQPMQVPKIKIVRMVFTGDNGQAKEVMVPTSQFNDDNFVVMAVPVTKVVETTTKAVAKKADGKNEGAEKPGPAAAQSGDYKLKSLVITADRAGTFYLCEMKTVKDDSKINVQSIGSQTVALQETVCVAGEATGGISQLKYSWDFDASNGVQEEYTGPVGLYTYYRGGDFTVTLTVSDIWGVMEPAVVTGEITVID